MISKNWFELDCEQSLQVHRFYLVVTLILLLWGSFWEFKL